MDNVKAKYKVGDDIFVKLWFRDDKATMVHWGKITGSRLQEGNFFSDRVLYNVSVEQADAPNMELTNLAEGFIGLGTPGEYGEVINGEIDPVKQFDDAVADAEKTA